MTDMIDPNVIVAILTSLGAGALSVGLVLFHGGRQAGKVEAAVNRLTGIETKLGKVDELAVSVGTLQNAFTSLRSDHKELKVKIDRVIEGTAEIRGKLASTHEE